MCLWVPSAPIPNMPESSSSSSSTSTTLLSLPTELLIRVLSHLDDPKLYDLILASRSLHACSLHTLFQRNFPALRKGRLYLDTGRDHQIHFLLPALHGSLDLTDVLLINIVFESPNLSRFFEEVRILTALVERLPQVKTFFVELTGQARSFGSANTLEMLEALRGMFEAVLRKGCTSLDVQERTGLWGPLFCPPKPQQIEQRRRKFVLKDLFCSMPSSGLFSGKKKATPGETTKRVKGLEKIWKETEHLKIKEVELEKKGEGAKEVVVPPGQLDDIEEGEPSVTVESSSRMNWTKDILFNGQIRIETELFFHPPWIDWTLSLFNHTGLAVLSISMDSFSVKDIVSHILPKIYIPGLQNFALRGHKMDMGSLAGFLERHGETLRNITLDLPKQEGDGGVGRVQDGAMAGPTNIDSDTISLSGDSSVTTKGAPPEPRPIRFYFPKVEQLCLTPSCVKWFFQNMVNSTKSHPQPTAASNPTSPKPATPPNLHLLPRLILLQISSGHYTDSSTFFAELDESLETLSEFISTIPPLPANRISSWFYNFIINTCSLGVTSYAAWFRSHSVRGTSSPLNALQTVTYLQLQNSYLSLKRTEAEFVALPGFLKLFKGVKSFGWPLVQEEVVKKLDEEYWKELKRSCPSVQEMYWSSPRLKLALDENGKARWIDSHTGKEVQRS
ncbi:hypothetical protein BDN72DRAFT_305663 [Pluteus cervinus]|uniref:Uncharacterized protein n=1 Tax=Pluteus cervinus TaxID=181527 RepID=A0ACD3ADL2_9AGAR|nr:hypothetical protein BDN72DRAFT_305663 [Pluteus cervinus]